MVAIWTNSTLISDIKMNLDDIESVVLGKELEIIDFIFSKDSKHIIKDIMVLPKKFQYTPTRQIGFIKENVENKETILEIVLFIKGNNFSYYPIIFDFIIKDNCFNIKNLESLTYKEFSIRLKKSIENLNGMYLQVLHDTFVLPNINTAEAIKEYIAKMIPITQSDYQLLDETYQERNNVEFLNKFNNFYNKLKYHSEINLDYINYFD